MPRPVRAKGGFQFIMKERLFERLRVSLPARLVCLWLAVALLTALFAWSVSGSWNTSAVSTDPVSEGALTDELMPGTVLEQALTADMDVLQTVQISCNAWRTNESSVLTAALLDGDSVLATAQASAADMLASDVLTFDFGTVTGVRGKSLTLRLTSGGSGLALWYGNTRSASKIEIAVETAALTFNGAPLDGELVLQADGYNELHAIGYVWLAGLLLALAGTLVLIRVQRVREKGGRSLTAVLEELYRRYSYLLKQLVSRDFKVKYKSSVLGMLWSFLNPALMTLVYYVVFSKLFHSSIENFVVYLMCGIILFNYFTDATNLGLNSIVGNAALITKVYMPKYIYPLSKVLSASINMFTSLVPLLVVMLLTGVRFTRAMLLIPLVLILLIGFALGVSLILSALMVFFRDVQFLWNVLTMMWNFLTPIFYPETIIPARFLFIYRLNPLYQYVTFLRSLILYGQVPSPASVIYCVVLSCASVLIGLKVFRSLQDDFALYL